MTDSMTRRLFVLGYPDRSGAEAAVAELTELTRDEFVSLDDWAIISKGADGELTSSTSDAKKSAAGKGAFAGGFAVALIAIAGPIGLAGVAVGAGVGAVAGAMHRAGFKDGDVKSVGELMQAGRTLLILTVPGEYADRFRDAIDEVPELKAADRRLESDVDGSSAGMLHDAIAEYKAANPA
jgi:uncharacterized membrane protein